MDRREPHIGLYRTVIKRVLDIALTVVALPFLLPVITVLALLIALKGANPFQSEEQVGKNGRNFRLWKLRSTIEGAGVTRLGQFMRNSSIDELPLFFNVLVGDMSLVGPRPMASTQKAHYPGEEYYSLRPGVTGNWQSAAIDQMSLAKHAVYDAQYNRTLSIATDVTILADTIKATMHSAAIK